MIWWANLWHRAHSVLLLWTSEDLKRIFHCWKQVNRVRDKFQELDKINSPPVHVLSYIPWLTNNLSLSLGIGSGSRDKQQPRAGKHTAQMSNSTTTADQQVMADALGTNVVVVCFVFFPPTVNKKKPKTKQQWPAKHKCLYQLHETQC